MNPCTPTIVPSVSWCKVVLPGNKDFSGLVTCWLFPSVQCNKSYRRLWSKNLSSRKTTSSRLNMNDSLIGRGSKETIVILHLQHTQQHVEEGWGQDTDKNPPFSTHILIYSTKPPCPRCIQLHTHSRMQTKARIQTPLSPSTPPLQTWLNRVQYELDSSSSGTMRTCLGPVRPVTPIPVLQKKPHTTNPGLARTVLDRGAFKEQRQTATVANCCVTRRQGGAASKQKALQFVYCDPPPGSDKAAFLLCYNNNYTWIETILKYWYLKYSNSLKQFFKKMYKCWCIQWINYVLLHMRQPSKLKLKISVCFLK